MKKNKLYAILGSLLILSSVSLISCGKEITSNNEINEEATKETKEEATKETKEEVKEEPTKEAKEEVKEEATKETKEEVRKETKEEPTKETSKDKKQDEQKVTDSKKPTIDSKEKVENNNKLKYPIFKNIENAKNTNTLVEEFVCNISSSNKNLNMNYKIMYQDKNFISIYFNGDIKSPDLAYPSKFKATLNINTGAGTPLKLNNLISFDSDFTKKFKEKLIKKCTEVGFEASTVFDLNNLNDLLNKSDNNNTYISDVQSYYDGKQLNVILSVPHALGDYIEISI